MVPRKPNHRVYPQDEERYSKKSRHALRKVLLYLLEQVVFSRFIFKSLFLAMHHHQANVLSFPDIMCWDSLIESNHDLDLSGKVITQ